VEAAIVVSSPMVPHICEELWSILGHEELLLNTAWPKWDDQALKAEEMLIVVQINGKLRSRITVAADATDKELEELSLKDSRIRDFIEGKQVKKVVVVPRKLINYQYCHLAVSVRKLLVSHPVFPDGHQVVFKISDL
jgi:leucyl-tRNA synthetase